MKERPPREPKQKKNRTLKMGKPTLKLPCYADKLVAPQGGPARKENERKKMVPNNTEKALLVALVAKDRKMPKDRSNMRLGK